MADTSGKLDIFDDGSCVDLIRLNGGLGAVNSGSFSVVSGTPEYTTGQFGQAYLGKIDTEVKMQYQILPAGTSTSCSISFWTKPGTVDGKTGFLYNFPGWGHLCVYYKYGSFRIDGSGNWYEIPSVSSKWYFVTAVWDAGDYRLYIDGSFVYEYSNVQRSDVGSVSGVFLNGFLDGAKDYRSDIATDQIRFFNRAITQDEINILKVESKSSVVEFEDVRITAENNLSEFEDVRAVDNFHIYYFEDKRKVLPFNQNIFEDVRDIHTGKAVIFEDVRKVSRNIVFNYFYDVRKSESDTPLTSVIIERVNT